MARTPTVWFRKATGWYMTTVGGVQHKLSPDKAEAQKLFYKLMGGERAPRGKCGLSTRKLLDLFLDRTREGKSESRHKASLCFLKPFAAKFGHRDPTTLKAYEVNAWLDGKDDWCGSTKAGFVVTVKAAMNWAVAEDYLEESPLAKLRRRAVARRDRLLTAEERAAILARVSPRFRDFLTVLDQTGCRPYSEAARLTAAMFDFDKGRAVLREHKNKKKGKRRVVYFPPALLARLKELAEEHPTGPLLRNKWGNPWTGTNTGTYLRRVARELGLDPFVAYDFRHTYISNAIVKGVPVEVVAELVGTSAKMIWQHYASVEKVPGAMQAAALKAVQ